MPKHASSMCVLLLRVSYLFHISRHFQFSFQTPRSYSPSLFCYPHLLTSIDAADGVGQKMEVQVTRMSGGGGEVGRRSVSGSERRRGSRTAEDGGAGD